MTTEVVCRQIASHLNSLIRKNGLTLEYAHLITGLSKETVRQAKAGNIRLRDRTAFKLADFIERETEGEIPASYVLSAAVKNFHGQDLKGADLSEEDLSNADLSYADLRGAKLRGTKLQRAKLTRAKLRDADLSGAIMEHTDLCGAILDGAQMINMRFSDADFSAASLQNVEMHNVQLGRSRMVGANLTNAKLHSVCWDTTGSRTRGIVLPDFNPAELSNGFACNDAIAKMILYEFPEDFEMRQFAEFVVSRMFPCYDGGLERMQKAYPHRMDDLEAMFAKYNDTWHLLDRWELHKILNRCHTLEEVEALKQTHYYKSHPWPVDLKIRKLQKS